MPLVVAPARHKTGRGPLPRSVHADVARTGRFHRSRFWVIPAWRQSTNAPGACCERTKAGSIQPSSMRRTRSPASFGPTGPTCRSSTSGYASNPQCSESRRARAKRNDVSHRWEKASDTRVVDGLALGHRDRHGERHRRRRGDRPDLVPRRVAIGPGRVAVQQPSAHRPTFAWSAIREPGGHLVEVTRGGYGCGAPLTSALRVVPSRVGRAIRFRSPSGVRRGRTGSGLGVFVPLAGRLIAAPGFPAATARPGPPSEGLGESRLAGEEPCAGSADAQAMSDEGRIERGTLGRGESS
jgi:hypothetical protein